MPNDEMVETASEGFRLLSDSTRIKILWALPRASPRSPASPSGSMQLRPRCPSISRSCECPISSRSAGRGPSLFIRRPTSTSPACSPKPFHADHLVKETPYHHRVPRRRQQRAVAAGIGQVLDGGLLIVIFATSGALEAVATKRTRDAVRSLLTFAPEQATRLLCDGSAEQVDTEVLAVGDVLMIRPGERSHSVTGPPHVLTLATGTVPMSSPPNTSRWSAEDWRIRIWRPAVKRPGLAPFDRTISSTRASLVRRRELTPRRSLGGPVAALLRSPMTAPGTCSPSSKAGCGEVGALACRACEGNPRVDLTSQRAIDPWAAPFTSRRPKNARPWSLGDEHGHGPGP
jgi:hypothetical protein